MPSIKKLIFFICLLITLWPAASHAEPRVQIVSVRASETITLQVPDAGRSKVFLLQNPDRLVADVPALVIPPEERDSIGMPEDYAGNLIKGVRYGRFDAETSRFVFDLAKPVRIANSEARGNELTIEIAAAKKTYEAKAKPKRNPVIVIDPGHGGVDPGAVSPRGIREKDVVLSYSKALRQRLLKSGKYDVMLTRDDDRFIPLRERIAIARKAGAALFISLHADSANDNVRGLSVYTVSEKASDQEAEALATRENKADVLADVDLSGEREDVAGILISLAQRETNNFSATLADLLVASLSKRVSLLERSHRFAGFAVLKAPDVPSVLIELGFLSDRTDEKLLRSKSYREKVIEGISDGVDKYFEKRKKMSGE